MRPVCPAVTVRDGDVSMGAVSGQHPGERDYFEVALKCGGLALVGETENRGGEAADTGQDAGRFHMPICHEAFQFGENVLSRMESKRMWFHGWCLTLYGDLMLIVTVS